LTSAERMFNILNVRSVDMTASAQSVTRLSSSSVSTASASACGPSPKRSASLIPKRCSAATMGEADLVPRLSAAGLAQVPAMTVLGGIAALAVALRRQWIGWLAVTFVVMSLYLGALLRLPRWLIDLSPVGRTTVASSVPVTALAVMVVVAIALTGVAGLIYRWRDAL
jgi:putative exporter of polyketide antibiotics